MSSERWRHLDRLFIEALQRAPDARLAFVIEKSGDDAALRADVLSLLSAADASAEFMAASAFERLATVVGASGWTLAPGESVGPYTVQGLLGSGGAGEVWRARDDRLGRDVAIKVLLPHVSDDPRGLHRFADEARAVGALNHPNIVAVYDIGDHHGVPFLVSECLEGTSLRARLEAGTMRVPEVIAIGLGVVQGLAAAHARNIVHRDLKPENVFVARDGQAVKILDFGVAKLQAAGDRLGAGLDTSVGSILGTAGYMAPEQVRGEEVDARTDLFALGVMLYEMLAGTAPFKRTSALETLNAILTVEPADLTDVNRAVPPELANIIMRLLRKPPEARFQSALDLIWALEQVNTRGAPVDRERVPAAPGWSRQLQRFGPVLAASALFAAALWVSVPREVFRSTPDADVVRFSWTLPAGVGLASAPAVSPDGRYVAFTGSDSARSRLLIRSLSAHDPLTIEGTDDARQPFWSPDSQWVGFFANGHVMKVSVAGGAPVAVADDRRAGPGTRRTERGGAWSSNGVIIYGPNFNPPSLFTVSVDGGTPVPMTTLDEERAENMHRFPSFLPDGNHFLYQVRASSAEGRGVWMGNVSNGASSVRILDVGSNPVYAPTSGDRGVLLYVANGVIEAQRFNSSRGTLIGPAHSLGIEAGSETLFHPAALGASSRVLAYSTQLASGNQIKAVSADGRAPTVVNDRQEQQWPRISPDGTRMAWLQIDPLEPNADIWVEDLARRTRTRVTTAPERDLGHVWSPDGRRLAYRPDVDDRRRLSIIAADGSGASQDLICPEAYCEPTDWSSDGRELIVNTYGARGTDVWALAVASGGTSRPLLQTPFNERDARLSPDRRWIAYVSDEAGRPEVSVRNVGESPRRYTVSPGGGDQVVWQRDGRGLYYVDPRGQLRNVSVRDTNGILLFGTAVELPVTIGSGHSNTQYDVAPDGRIYYMDPTTLPLPTEIRLVLGWQTLLK